VNYHGFLLKTGFKYKLTYLKDLIQPGILVIPTCLPRKFIFIAYFLRPFGIIVRRLKQILCLEINGSSILMDTDRHDNYLFFTSTRSHLINFYSEKHHFHEDI